MKGLGYVPDRTKAPDEEPDWDASPTLRAVRTTAPPRWSNRELVPDILDQGNLGACVSHAWMQAVRASHVLQGVPNPKLGSRLFGYYFARAFDHDTANDNGTQLRNLGMTLNKFGFPTEDFWPYSDDTSTRAPFTRMPSSAALRAAFDQKSPTEYRRITETGDDRIPVIKNAVAQQYLVVFGTDVSKDFCNGSEAFPGRALPPPKGKAIAGGHAMTITGYDGDKFDILNSWSADFCDQGYCTFAPEYLAWERTRDLWVVKNAPRRYSE